jgi:hypothetical protein
MNPVPLHLRYKGDRNYLHGSDIYNAINSLAPTITGFQNAYLNHISFRSFCRRDADVSFDPPDEGHLIAATARIVAGPDYTKKAWIVESERKIEKRYDFDESRVVGKATCTSSSITLCCRTGFSPIEVVLAMTKSLSYQAYPKISGKWVFAQLDLMQPFLTDYNSIRIERKACIADRFTLNRIFQDDTHVGDIRFIVGNP